MSDTQVLPSSLINRRIARVCCHCRRVQAPSGEWRPEPDSPDGCVTHVICPRCLIKHYPDVVAKGE